MVTEYGIGYHILMSPIEMNERSPVPMTALRWFLGFLIILIFSITCWYLLQFLQMSTDQKAVLQTVLEKRTQQHAALTRRLSAASASISSLSAELTDVKSQDQLLINKRLEEEVKQINVTYTKSADLHERMNDLIYAKVKTDEMEKLYALAFTQLAKKNYTSASATLADLEKKIKAEEAKLASTFSIPANAVVDTKPPGSGYRRQRVDLDIGSYLVDIVSADLGSTRVIVDTASDGDCRDNCPVLSLGDYVGRSGAYAGINGSYFCPASYPSCVGKTNSFDTLVMNKNKKYINSDNNVYSTVPAAIFQGGSVRFVGQSLEWGRDTGVDGVIANQPLLVSGGKVVFGGSGDPKQGSKGSRSFVGSAGNTAYIGVVHNATVAEVARVLAAMGVQGALNLDSGGSTALWSGGYKVGPGRNIPNAVLFVRK